MNAEPAYLGTDSSPTDVCGFRFLPERRRKGAQPAIQRKNADDVPHGKFGSFPAPEGVPSRQQLAGIEKSKTEYGRSFIESLLGDWPYRSDEPIRRRTEMPRLVLAPCYFIRKKWLSHHAQYLLCPSLSQLVLQRQGDGSFHEPDVEIWEADLSRKRHGCPILGVRDCRRREAQQV